MLKLKILAVLVLLVIIYFLLWYPKKNKNNNQSKIQEHFSTDNTINYKETIDLSKLISYFINFNLSNPKENSSFNINDKKFYHKIHLGLVDIYFRNFINFLKYNPDLDTGIDTSYSYLPIKGQYIISNMSICYYFEEIQTILGEQFMKSELSKNNPFDQYIFYSPISNLNVYKTKFNNPTEPDTNPIRIFKVESVNKIKEIKLIAGQKQEIDFSQDPNLNLGNQLIAFHTDSDENNKSGEFVKLMLFSENEPTFLLKYDLLIESNPIYSNKTVKFDLTKRIKSHIPEYTNFYNLFFTRIQNNNIFHINNLCLENLVMEYNEPYYNEKKLKICVSKNYKTDYLSILNHHNSTTVCQNSTPSPTEIPKIEATENLKKLLNINQYTQTDLLKFNIILSTLSNSPNILGESNNDSKDNTLKMINYSLNNTNHNFYRILLFYKIFQFDKFEFNLIFKKNYFLMRVQSLLFLDNKEDFSFSSNLESVDNKIIVTSHQQPQFFRNILKNMPKTIVSAGNEQMFSIIDNTDSIIKAEVENSNTTVNQNQATISLSALQPFTGKYIVENFISPSPDISTDYNILKTNVEKLEKAIRFLLNYN